MTGVQTCALPIWMRRAEQVIPHLLTLDDDLVFVGQIHSDHSSFTRHSSRRCRGHTKRSHRPRNGCGRIPRQADFWKRQVRKEPDDLLCSRNARPQKDEREQPGALLARRAPTIKRIGRTPTLVLCSRNARPVKGLVRRPHVDQHGCPSKRRKASELGGII